MASQVQAGAARGPPSRGHLLQHGYHAESRSRQQHGGQRGRVNFQPEEQEEGGGEQVAQRPKQTVRLLGERSGESDAHQEGADGGRHLKPLSHAGLMSTAGAGLLLTGPRFSAHSTWMHQRDGGLSRPAAAITGQATVWLIGVPVNRAAAMGCAMTVRFNWHLCKSNGGGDTQAAPVLVVCAAFVRC